MSETEETSDGETKVPARKWSNVDSGTIARNTATGVLVNVYSDEGETMTFILGEHWDPDKGEFVAINSPDEKLAIARTALDRVCLSADLSTANENVHDLYKIASKALWETK